MQIPIPNMADGGNLAWSWFLWVGLPVVAIYGLAVVVGILVPRKGKGR